MAISNNNTGIRTGVCTSSTRPTAPYEGQMIYETDTDMVAIWNGTAWRYLSSTTPTNGTVLQMVYAFTASQVATSSSTLIDTGLTATITPKSTTSKILVCIQQSGLLKLTNDTYMLLNLYRGASNISTILAQGGVTQNTTTIGFGGAGVMVLDEPATTSAVTYKTQFNSVNNNSVTAVQHSGAMSTIVLMEVAA